MSYIRCCINRRDNPGLSCLPCLIDLRTAKASAAADAAVSAVVLPQVMLSGCIFASSTFSSQIAMQQQYSTICSAILHSVPASGVISANHWGSNICYSNWQDYCFTIRKTLHIVTVTIMVNDSTTISISDMSSNITWLKIKVRYYAWTEQSHSIRLSLGMLATGE